MQRPRWQQNWQCQAEGNLKLEKLDVPRDAEPRVSFGVFFKDHDVGLESARQPIYLLSSHKIEPNLQCDLAKCMRDTLCFPKNLNETLCDVSRSWQLSRIFCWFTCAANSMAFHKDFSTFLCCDFCGLYQVIKKLLARSFAGNTECPWVYTVASSLDST